MAKKWRDVKRALRDDGWTKLRQEGSHEQWGKDGAIVTISSGGHDNREVPTGTLKGIRVSTGLEELR